MSAARPARLLTALFRTSTLPHWRRHRLRTLLTVSGVALGVATGVVVADVGHSVLASFEHELTTMAGNMALEVTRPGGTVEESLLAAVRTTSGVADAAGMVEAFVPLPGRDEDVLYLVGFDFLGSRAWEAQFPRRHITIEDEILFVSDPTSVALPAPLAARLGLAPDGDLPVVTPAGPRTLHWRGTLGDIAAAALFDGAVGVMDLPAAQLLLDRVDRFDRIGVILAPGASAADVRARLLTTLGAGIEVAAPELRGREGERALLSLRSMLLCNASFALLVGALIVYHTVAVSMRQRRREVALLEMLGIHRRTLVQLGMLESGLLAATGGALGVLLGRGLAAGVAPSVGGMVSEIWLRVDVAAPAPSTLGAALAVAAGLASALVATAVALHGTFRLPTVEALRPPGLPPPDTHPFAGPVLVGLVLVAAAWTLAFAPQGLGLAALVGVVTASHDLAYAGMALLAPPLVFGAGHVLRSIARRVGPLPFRLAAENLPRAPRLGGATVATIAIATGMALATACLVQSFEHAWLEWIEQHFGADLFVGSGARLRLLAGPPMRTSVARTLASVPGIAAVEPFRVRPFRLGDEATFLQGISVEHRLAHGGLAMVEGDFAIAAPALRDGSAVLLSDNLATRLGRHRGDEILLATPHGERRFRIAGTFIDYQGSLDLGAVAVDSGQLAAIWNDDDANLFRLWLAPGTAPSAARSAVLARLGAGYFVITGRQFVDGTRRVLTGFFASAWMLSLVVTLVGVIGIVNAQLATVLDRSVEIVTLRTVGLSIHDLTRSVLIECVVLGALGGLAGAALGIMLGAQFLRCGLPLVTGWHIPLVVPYLVVATVVVTSALVSGLAGYVPARAVAAAGTRHRSSD